MQSSQDLLNGDGVNIFAQTGVSEDVDLTETYSEELVNEARTKYEHRVKELDTQDSKLDLQLSQIDTQHNALKTEYDTVKQIVSKSIERSYKTFNA
jgi:chaperonin cofactor prefoldin